MNRVVRVVNGASFNDANRNALCSTRGRATASISARFDAVGHVEMDATRNIALNGKCDHTGLLVKA